MSAPRSRRGRPLKQTAGTNLARARYQAGYTQQDMASLTGLSLSTYHRLEHNQVPGDVNLRELVNCAMVLRVEVHELFEDDWLQWRVFDAQRPAPPG